MLQPSKPCGLTTAQYSEKEQRQPSKPCGLATSATALRNQGEGIPYIGILGCVINSLTIQNCPNRLPSS